MDLSFSGAGFMGCYYFGVVNCWNKYIPRDRVRRVAGASAGSLIAAYYLMDLPLEDCLREIIEMTEDARSRPLGVFDRSNQIVDVLPRQLDKMFPQDAHKRVNGRLHVCMTRLKDLKSVVVNEFETRKDLIDALNCSCFIPVWSGNHVSTYKGVKYIDGGFTNNMPVFDEHTVRVSCFSGESDIAPYDRARLEALKATVQGMSVNLSWKNLRRARRALWPPPPSFIMDLLKFGFHDTKDFILDNDLIQCDRCFAATERELQPIYSLITPTISPAASPNVSRHPSLLNLADLQRQGGGGNNILGSFRLRRSKRANDSKSRNKQKSSSAKSDEKRQSSARHLPPVRIKEHRRQSATACQFETNRNKSGKQIAQKALERLKREADQAEREQAAGGKASFAAKLREKLQQVAAKSASVEKPPKPEPPSSRDTGGATSECPVPTIVVVDEPPVRAEDGAERMSHEAELNGRPETNGATKFRADSLSSSASNDSAVVLETPSVTPSMMIGSPAEKFFAGSKQRAQSISSNANTTNATTTTTITTSTGLLGARLPEDRFSLAPSPLPSCPPSPNLNRHCTECIRLRQQARMDDLDESIKRAAELYGAVKSKDPEREFSSIRWKLACWLRQIGTPKYSYSFQDELGGEPTAHELNAAAAANTSSASDDDDDEVFAPGETMAERKAKRKASHPLAWPPPAKIQAGS